MIDVKLSNIKGLGPKKEEALNRLNIFTIEDLVYFLPKKYNDKRNPVPVSCLEPSTKAMVKVIVKRVVHTGYYNKKSPLIIKAEDSSGKLDIVFFNSNYLASYFKPGVEYILYGLALRSKSGTIQMVNPEFEVYQGQSYPGIEPVYQLTKGISQKDFRKFQRECIKWYDQLEEWLSPQIIEENKLCDICYALENLHFPKDEHAFKIARFRIIFEELFIFQLGLALIKRQGIIKSIGAKCQRDDSEEQFIESLGFKLTPGQQKAWKEIKADLESDDAMNRLLQGDVGSGKTAIAQIASFKTVKSGFQSAIMAPTEILAKQHYQTFTKDFSPFGIRVGLLCSSMKTKEKEEVMAKLANGEIDILIGTHALIESKVKFANLGLVVTDEQHRFGVKQRNLLNEKGLGANILVMTATPIPRTLAVILYGELDISVIETMPVGRLPIITKDYAYNSRKQVYSKVYEELLKGHQAYVITPLIEESDNLDVLSAEEVHKDLIKRFPNHNVGLLHGNMSQQDKDKAMDDFLNKRIDILVSTVVVEVGVNVPNATVMVIENCERFGLAQLHQLRGRVGRGNDQSYCYLIHKSQSEVSRERCKILTESTDGFEIAEYDLKLRGPGDFFGTKQHGLPELRNADLVNHISVLQNIRPQVDKLLTEDPDLALVQNKGIRNRVMSIFGDKIQITI